MANGSRCHLTNNLAILIRREGNKGANSGEGSQVTLLIAVQECDHGSSRGLQCRQKFRCHPFTIQDEPFQMPRPRRLLVPFDDPGEAAREMHISSMGGGK